MAVEDKYVNADIVSGDKTQASENDGAKLVYMTATAAIAAADDNLSQYRLFKNINPHLIPVKFEILNGAITAGTDYDLGLFETLTDGVGGAVIDRDVFLDGADMSSARARGAALDGLSAVAITDAHKTIWELAGHTLATRKIGYDIVLTGVVVGSAAENVVLLATFAQGS